MVGIGRTGDGGKNSSGSQDLGQNIETPRKVFGRYLWSFKGYRIYGVADAAEVYAYATRDRAMAETASVAASAAETCVFGAKTIRGEATTIRGGDDVCRIGTVSEIGPSDITVGGTRALHQTSGVGAPNSSSPSGGRNRKGTAD